MKKLVFLLLLLSVKGFSQNIELGVNIGQTEDIFYGTISDDGKHFFTHGSNTISIWDAKTGKLIRNIVNEDGILKAFYVDNGESILIVPMYNTIRIYNIRSGSMSDQMIEPGSLHYADLSADKKSLLVISDAGVSVFDVPGRKKLLTAAPKKGIIISTDFSANGEEVHFTASDSTWQCYHIKTGKKIFEKLNDQRIIRTMDPSVDGSMMALVNQDNSISIWSADGSKKLKQFPSTQSQIFKVQFANNDLQLISTSADSITRIWDVRSAQLIRKIYMPEMYSLKLSKNRTEIMEGGSGAYIRLYNLPDGVLTDSIACEGFQKQISYDDKHQLLLAYTSTNMAYLFNGATHQPISKVDGAKVDVVKALFANDKKSILLIDEQNTFTVWDKEKGTRKNTQMIDFDSTLFKLYCTPALFNGKYIVNSENEVITTMLMSTFELGPEFIGHRADVNYAEFSADGKKLVSCSMDSTAIIWDVESGKPLFTLKGHQHEVNDVKFNNDATKVITAGQDDVAIIWNALNGKIIHRLKGHTSFIEYVMFNHSGTRAATQGSDGNIMVWDVASGKLLYTIKYERIMDNAAQFSPDDKYLTTLTAYNVLSVFNASNGEKLFDLSSHKSVISSFSYSHDTKYLMTNSYDRTCKIWDPSTGKELLTFMNLPDNEWLILHPSGLFDASSTAMEKLYWVQGLDIIDFTQLKDRYYEPGLWQKILKGEDLREVKGFNEKIPLYPDIKLSPIDSKGDLKIELANRGGGIGKIKLYINGKEVADDIRDQKFNPESAAATIVQNLKDHPYLIKGDTNIIEVKAYNKDNWVLSRAETLTFVDKRNKEESAPELFVISIGVSDYQGNDIDLKFPSKDASDICTSIQVGAKRLFGIEKTHGYLLNSKTEIKPTKENIKKIFEEVSTKAHSNDLIVVYLSGHGINWGGDEGDWYYLTQDAFSASSDAYNDEAIRTKSGVSSKELSDWIKKIPALKQVMIIDACASGRIVEDLVAQRDIPANTIRSLDRMKDRTGLHIITGCAADAVSFEASRYGQGVLTYSLLEGMKGLSLREGKFIDIITWFQYARERVPILASGIGGIQEPQIISPNGSESFDIGQMNEEDKKLIPLSNIKPMYVRSNFQDEDDLDDVLALGDKMDEALNEFSSKGVESTIVFVDVKEFPDAYKLIGRYKRENNQVILTLKVKQGTEVMSTLSITGTDANDVVNQLLKKINDF